MDDRGRWYAATVANLQGGAQDKQMVRFELHAWHGLVKSNLCLPENSDRIRVAGSQQLITVEKVDTLGSHQATADDHLHEGVRVLVKIKWQDWQCQDWYGAAVGPGWGKPAGKGWFRFDFDGFENTGMQFFDTARLIAGGRLRIADQTDTPSKETSSAIGIREPPPEVLSETALEALCRAEKLCGKRISVFWPDEQRWFRGAVVQCRARPAHCSRRPGAVKHP
jgi:hypothetical protein